MSSVAANCPTARQAPGTRAAEPFAASEASRAFPKRLVGVLFCAYLIAFIDRGLVSVAAAPIKQDLGLSDVGLGLLIGPAFVIFYCLCGIPLGWLADRTSRRAVLALGMMLWSLMTGLCALSESFWSFLVARLGVGLGEACLVPAGVSLIAQATPPRHLAKALGIFLMGATSGNAIALLAGGHLLDSVALAASSWGSLHSMAPWRILFLLAALPGIVLSAAVMTIGEPSRKAPPQALGPALKTALRNLWQLRASYGYLSVATACAVILAQIPLAWMPLYYVRTFGESPGASAILVGLALVGTAPVGQWLGSVLIDKLRGAGVVTAPHILQAGCALACVPAAVIFCTSHRLLWCEAALAAYNLVAFAATPAGLTAWRLLTPEKTMSLTIALLMAAVTLVAIGIGASIVGGLSDKLSASGSALGSSLLLVIASAAVIGASCAAVGRASFGRTIMASAGVGGKNDIR